MSEITDLLDSLSKLPDALFSKCRWYRRMIGGTWYHTLDLPFLQGGFNVWSRTYLESVPHILLGVEEYE